MTWESGSTSQQRLRAGYAVFILGTFMLLAAWVLWVMRGTESQGDATVRGEKLEPPSPDQLVPALNVGVLLIGVVLVLVLFISIIAFIRISRNYRRYLLKKSSKPTPTSDVWQMHRVPDIPDYDSESEEDRPEAPG
jgi:ABC-type Fe3+ transport system permease subunit